MGLGDSEIYEMKTSDFYYDLPHEFIAQTPIEPRDSARLLVLNRKRDSVTHTTVRSIGDYLAPGDMLVLNETRVIPARLYGVKLETGAKVEIFLLNKVENNTWECLVRGKGLKQGVRVIINNGPRAEILSDLGGGRRLVCFDSTITDNLNQIGNIPLPPYIKSPISDPERYQTIYARIPGSVAAPTAGLHFTDELINELKSTGINFCSITLHIGLDTFKPVTEKNPADHVIHSEWCSISDETADKINQTRQQGGRIVAIGTSSVRALEYAYEGEINGGLVQSYAGKTDLFILPGYKFKVVNVMLTNFHLPQSTLIMLVCAFASRRQIFKAYKIAVDQDYRFYSFGDAMLIL